MKRLPWTLLALMLVACRCHDIPPVGGDVDSHGCNPSTGATWCAKEKSCLRMWELAKKKDLGGLSAEAYCAQK